MEHLSDTALLEQILSRNEKALSELFRREAGYLQQLVRRILNPELVEEAIREAFWLLWVDPTKIKRLSGDKPTRDVYRLVQQTAHRLRFATRAIEIPLDEVRDFPTMNTFEDRVIDRMDIALLFQTLTAGERELLEMHGYMGMTLQEIAQYQGMPLGSVGSKIKAAKARVLAQAKKLGCTR
jgi:RNA polymerase sigma factor (sigma-70 family)